MAVIGELATLITARTEPFTKGLKTAGQQAKTFTNTLTGTLGGGLKKLGGILTSTTGMIAGLGGALTVGGILSKSVKLAIAYEDMQTSFTTYLKDLGKARSMMADLSRFSASTPFQSADVQDAAKQLLAFGFEANQIMGMMQTIGELAAGSQKPMADFVDILGKIKASGIASMGDVNRLADRGVPIFQELAKQMGVATSEVRELVGQSKVGFADIYAAIQKVTTGSGLFAGSISALSETTSGLWSTFKDNVDLVLREVGSAILEGLNVKDVVKTLTELAQIYRQDIVDATTAGVQGIKSAFSGLASFMQDVRQIIEMAGTIYHGGMAGAARLGQMTNINPGNWRGLSLTSRLIGSQLRIGPSDWAMQQGPRHQRAYEAGLHRLRGGDNYGRAPQLDRNQARIAQATEQTSRTLMNIWQQQEAENELRRRAYQNQIDMYGGIVEILD